MIRCPKCDTEKPDSEFRSDASRPNGKCAQCKTCKDAWRKEYVAKNAERIAARRREYFEKPGKKEHALKRNIEYRARPENQARAKARHLEYYGKHRDRYLAQQKSRMDRNWSKRILASARSASGVRVARGRNCPCTVTLEHIESLWVAQDGRCYFTGLELRKERDRLDTVSLDRLDPSIGYEPGNVVLAIKAMNFAKTGHSEAEFFELLERLRWELPFKLSARNKRTQAA